MSSPAEERLIFWSFFERLEKELSYERWIDKYRLFWQTLASGAIPYDEDWLAFRRFCKFLYLQNHQDEERFDQLLEEAIAQEKKWLLSFWRQAAPEPLPIPDTASTDVTAPPDIPPTTPPGRPPAPPPSETRTVPPPEPATATKYFHPQLELQAPQELIDPASITRPATHYLHSDEYFPTNRREMVKSWQYLRRRERVGATERINIPATVKKMAREGVLTEPEYEASYLNRKDILFLFADSRGSMAPFHELSKRLIETAHGEGGHRKAPTFYYQNAPVEYLYQAPNLTNPIPLKSAMQRANRNVSYAFIISDAGAARGGKNAEQIERRLLITRPFLQLLQAHMAYVIWLNPMPEHRWAGTAAEMIAREPGVTTMIPVLEEGAFNYQDVIRRIIKYKVYRT